MFRGMVTHSFVPDALSIGNIILLVKSKMDEMIFYTLESSIEQSLLVGSQRGLEALMDIPGTEHNSTEYGIKINVKKVLKTSKKETIVRMHIEGKQNRTDVRILLHVYQSI